MLTKEQSERRMRLVIYLFSGLAVAALVLILAAASGAISIDPQFMVVLVGAGVVSAIIAGQVAWWVRRNRRRE